MQVIARSSSLRCGWVPAYMELTTGPIPNVDWCLLSSILPQQVAALRDKMADQRTERGQVEHYRQVRV